jgi:hypothetical protein
MCVCGPEYQKHDYLKFLIFRNCINYFQDSIRIFENLVPHPSHGGSGDISVAHFIWLALPLSSWVTHHLPHSSP